MPTLCIGAGERDVDRVLDAAPISADFVLGFVFQDELVKQVIADQGADGGVVRSDRHGVDGAVHQQPGRDGMASFAVGYWVRGKAESMRLLQNHQITLFTFSLRIRRRTTSREV